MLQVPTATHIDDVLEIQGNNERDSNSGLTLRLMNKNRYFLAWRVHGPRPTKGHPSSGPNLSGVGYEHGKWLRERYDDTDSA